MSARGGKIGPVRWVRCIALDAPELGLVTFLRLGPVLAVFPPLHIAWLRPEERRP